MIHDIVFLRRVEYATVSHNPTAVRNVSIYKGTQNIRNRQIVSTLKPARRKTIMQKQPFVQPSSQARAEAIDKRELLLRYRLLQILAKLLSLATALGVYQIFIR